MYGRIEMMSALCPAWAHTYQTMCLGFSPEQLGPENFRLPKPKKKFSILPGCRTTTRIIEIDFSGWKVFTDGSCKRQVNDTDLAGRGIAAVSPDNLVRILCGPVVCDPRQPEFLGATSCSNNTADLTGLAEALRWIGFFHSPM